MKKISIISIISILLYFSAVTMFLITKTDMALTLWELMTIEGVIVYTILLTKICDVLKSNDVHKRLVSIFLACSCALTSVAHIVNITVTRNLISQGVNVPDYFKIGCWPSVEMAVDYLAWGLFMGLAFLCLGISIKEKLNKFIKFSSILTGILCILGFVGALAINENMWYLAPMGYGIIPIIICIKMMKLENK